MKDAIASAEDLSYAGLINEPCPQSRTSNAGMSPDS
jgi:hypothetical protein